jgi:hypothetical protein
MFDSKLKVYDGVFIRNALEVLGIMDEESVNINKVYNVLKRCNKNAKM